MPAATPSSASPLTACAALLALVGTPVGLRAQDAASPPASPAWAPAYNERFQQLQELDGGSTGSADVTRLVLRRDAAELTLEGGRLYLLPAIGGRTVAVAYEGRGTFTFKPRHPVERRQLLRTHKTEALSAPIRQVVLLFSDTTLAELSRSVSFAPGQQLPGALQRRVREMVDYFSDPESKSPDPDVMGDLLNVSASSLFYAHVARESGDPLMFMVNPYEVESVRLLGRARQVGWVRVTDVVSQARREGDSTPSDTERWAQAEVVRYVMDVALPRTNSGEVRFAASAKMDIVARQTVGPWIAFGLYPKLQVDSARWADGTPAIVYKRKDAPDMWLRADRALGPGETRTVTVFYHGDLIDRFSDFFFIKSSIAWYPVALEGRTKAVFDLTFNTPRTFVLASVGERTDSAEVEAGMIRTRWVTPQPIRNASFNVGLFESYHLDAEQPALSVLYSERAHKMMAQSIRDQARAIREDGGVVIEMPTMKAFAKDEVGADVRAALKFFSHVYGELPVKRLYATEIPYAHGEAFPGLIHLSLSTFVDTDIDGFDEFFRAHEVAHQWWGIGVDYATYHDRWLSEGFASFAGLWYLQTVRNDNKKYFGMLDRWKANVMLRRDNGKPIWLGHRVAEARDGSDYNVLIYEKGAWAMHMLRILMLDLKTMSEDRFTNAMRDFYGTYRGRRASTEDFRRIIEKHNGADMGWFFDQWIYGSAIPTYRVSWASKATDGGKHVVHLRVVQEGVPDTFQMYVPVTIDLGKNSFARLRVKVKGPVTELDLPVQLPAKPVGVKFNDMAGVLADVK